jgi:hypothetical protein
VKGQQFVASNLLFIRRPSKNGEEKENHGLDGRSAHKWTAGKIIFEKN